MSTPYARLLVAAPVAVLAAVVGVTTALAAATWTVRPGGPVSVSLPSGRVADLRDTSTGTVLSCTSAHLSGTLKHGGGLPGTGIGSVTSGSFTNCNGPIWLPFTLTATDLPWHVNLTSYNATTGVATGNLSHVQLKLAGPSCRAVIDGTSGTASDGIVRFSYATSTATLTVLPNRGNLHFYNLSGCAGLFATGDPATFSGKLSVRPKQTITSP
jgi:hypothetical protein